MKKHLFFGAALLMAANAFSQNAKLAKPTGVINTPFDKYDVAEPTGQNSSVFVGPTKKIKHVVNTHAKIASATNFTGAMNVLGYLLSEQKPLHYTKGINAVSFVSRKSNYYTSSPVSNSGSIVGLWSTNLGATWDSTCIWANANNLARYPQGAIYNPFGNTNVNNAYFVGAGPFTSSTPTWGGTTNGSWYTSKQITTPGNTTPGTDMQSTYYVGGPLKKHYMPRTSFTAIEGGLVRTMGNIVNDPDNTTSNVTFGLRGEVMVKGQFNAGVFVWSVDSFIPPTNVRTDGSKLIGSAAPLQAWDNAGVVGYVITLGSRAGAGPTMNGMQPIVYKTTNSGASWALLPANDFQDCNFQGVSDRCYPIKTNTAIVCPNFQASEGMDATVDASGQLHLAAMVYGHYQNHVDSMGYRYVFGGEKYSYPNNGPFGYPIIYDFYTKSTGGWDYHMVDSMGTEGPSGTSGQPGFATNPWTSATAKYALDARIQMSRSDDGNKIFYSWTESDSTVVGLKWNIYPDIKLKGYDVNTKMVTQRMNITTGVTGADQQAYWHFMSTKAAGSSSSCMTIPFTISYNGTNYGDGPIGTYYLDGVQVCPADFNIPSLSPKACPAGIKTAEAFNYDVLNFPNPATDATTIIVSLNEASNFEVVIYNSIGQIIDTYKVNGQVGANEINIDLSSFNSGIYFYNVKVGNSVVTKKLVVQ